jgi:hypothetical protein
MIRRLLLGTGAVALVMSATTGVGMGIASATPPPVDMSGTVTCDVTGVLHFSTPLTNGGTVQTTMSLSASLTLCTGAGTTTDGVTISGGTLAATPVATMANNCGAVLSGSSLPKFRGTIQWAATGGTATNTKLKLIHSSVYDNLGTGRLVVGLPTTLKSGSYAQAGTTATFAHLSSNSADSKLTSLCATGGAGLQTIAFGAPGGVASGTVTFQAGV